MMKPDLKSVSSELPDPPYPADTKAGSFSFDLEMDRLVASDTWSLLSPDIRPWAMMSWALSWLQVPCGSWPMNDDVIAARLGIDRQLFQMKRDEILRGWIPSSDKRMYHPQVTLKVQSMLAKRDKWSKKRFQQNQSLKSKVPGDSLETLRGVPGESPPSISSSSTVIPPISPKGGTRKWKMPDWLDKEAWDDFEGHRKEIRQPLTDRAREKAAKVLEGMSADQQRACVDRTIQARWAGLFPDKAKAGGGNSQGSGREDWRYDL